MKFGFYVKVDEKAKEFSLSIQKALLDFGQEISSIEDADILIIIGGDGTFLSAARKFSKKPMVGINLGRLGFLTEIPKKDAIYMLKDIIEGKYKIIKRMMLDVFLNNKYLGAYLNDAVLARSYLSRLIDIEVYQGKDEIADLRADGVIVSTPTGSTAYALSAGGPILTPELQNILIVPICPHTISIRPILLSSEASISLKLGDKTREAYLTLDGQEFFDVKKEDIITVKKSNIFCNTISVNRISFFDILRDKLGYI